MLTQHIKSHVLYRSMRSRSIAGQTRLVGEEECSSGGPCSDCPPPRSQSLYIQNLSTCLPGLYLVVGLDSKYI